MEDENLFVHLSIYMFCKRIVINKRNQVGTNLKKVIIKDQALTLQFSLIVEFLIVKVPVKLLYLSG